ncbi:kinase domain protein [Pelomyxa schiedti]|nr:kinase domain protein [Pelomyxa schiedti]
MISGLMHSAFVPQVTSYVLNLLQNSQEDDGDDNGNAQPRAPINKKHRYGSPTPTPTPTSTPTPSPGTAGRKSPVKPKGFSTVQPAQNQFLQPSTQNLSPSKKPRGSIVQGTQECSSSPSVEESPATEAVPTTQPIGTQAIPTTQPIGTQAITSTQPAGTQAAPQIESDGNQRRNPEWATLARPVPGATQVVGKITEVRTTFGSGPTCQVRCDHPAVKPLHFTLEMRNWDGGDWETEGNKKKFCRGFLICHEPVIVGPKHMKPGESTLLLESEPIWIENEEFTFTNNRHMQKKIHGNGRTIEINNRIASGEFGAVWTGFDHLLKRAAAVKIVDLARLQKKDPDLKNDPKFRENIQREDKILAKLNHPNIPKLYMTYESKHGKHYYIGMEFIPGRTLHKVIHDSPDKCLSECEIKEISRQIFSALEHVHKSGYTHRDIKPENIILREQPPNAAQDPIPIPDHTPYIVDFGLANKTKEMKSMCGTPNYTAPEMLEGKPCTALVDMWSMGAVLWYCFTANAPFKNLSEIKVGKLDFSTPYWQNVSGPAKLLITKLLSCNLDERPNSSLVLQDRWFQAEPLPHNLDSVAKGDSRSAVPKAKIPDPPTTTVKSVEVTKTSTSDVPMEGVPPLKSASINSQQPAPIIKSSQHQHHHRQRHTHTVVNKTDVLSTKKREEIPPPSSKPQTDDVPMVQVPEEEDKFEKALQTPTFPEFKAPSSGRSETPVNATSASSVPRSVPDTTRPETKHSLPQEAKESSCGHQLRFTAPQLTESTRHKHRHSPSPEQPTEGSAPAPPTAKQHHHHGSTQPHQKQVSSSQPQTSVPPNANKHHQEQHKTEQERPAVFYSQQPNTAAAASTATITVENNWNSKMPPPPFPASPATTQLQEEEVTTPRKLPQAPLVPSASTHTPQEPLYHVNRPAAAPSPPPLLPETSVGSSAKSSKPYSKHGGGHHGQHQAALTPPAPGSTQSQQQASPVASASLSAWDEARRKQEQLIAKSSGKWLNTPSHISGAKTKSKSSKAGAPGHKKQLPIEPSGGRTPSPSLSLSLSPGLSLSPSPPSQTQTQPQAQPPSPFPCASPGPSPFGSSASPAPSVTSSRRYPSSSSPSLPSSCSSSSSSSSPSSSSIIVGGTLNTSSTSSLARPHRSGKISAVPSSPCLVDVGVKKHQARILAPSSPTKSEAFIKGRGSVLASESDVDDILNDS